MTFEKGNKYAKGLTTSGRPPKFKNGKVLCEQIQAYFNDCLKEKLRPTVTGLALFLGFSSRQSLQDYKLKDAVFSYPIKRALLVIENEYELRLADSNVSGIIFALKNMDWHDKQEFDIKDKKITKLVVEFVEGKKRKRKK